MGPRLKVFTGISVCLLYALLGALIRALVWNDKWRRRIQAGLISKTSRVLLKIIGIKVKSIGSLNGSGPYLVVSNHLSYVDVMVISSVIPSIFVTSTDTKKSLIEGPLTSLGGCVMVNRRDKSNLPSEITEIARVMSLGSNVVFFPEATTSSGEGLLRFRRPLFQAAFISQLNILPLCINYEKIDGEKIDFKNRGKLFAFEHIPIASQLARLLTVKSIDVELRILNQIKIESLKDTAQAAEESQKEISGYFRPIQLPPGIASDAKSGNRSE